MRPKSGFDIVVAPSPVAGLSLTTAKRTSGASVGFTLYEARNVDATVAPLPLPSGMLYAATVVSERTTVPGATGRSWNGSEYGGGGGGGAGAGGTEVMTVGSSATTATTASSACTVRGRSEIAAAAIESALAMFFIMRRTLASASFALMS